MNTGLYGFEYIDDSQATYRRRKLTAADIKTMSEHERAFYKCEMYIGSREHISRPEYIYDFNNKKLVKAQISTPEAFERLLLELISNATDNALNSRLKGIPVGNISITVTNISFTIRSEGEPIPIDLRQGIQVQTQRDSGRGPYYPATTIDAIFGVIGTSTNYDKSVIRTGCGTNGLGSKLVNIFGQRFIATVGNNIDGFLANSEWSHNMRCHVLSETNPAYRLVSDKWTLVGDRYNGPNFVEITWYPDFRPFKLPGFTPEIYSLIFRHLCDASFNAKVVCNFNGVIIDYRSSLAYASLFFPDNKKLVHYEFRQEDKETVKSLTKADLENRIINAQIRPLLTAIVIDDDSTTEFTLSFANGMITRDGGCHVDEVKDKFFDQVKDMLKKDHDEINKENNGVKITAVHLKQDISFIISYFPDNPSYGSQSKTKLSGPKVKVDLPDIRRDIKSWSVFKSIETYIDRRALENMSKKASSKRGKRVSVDTGDDANLAGTKESLKTTLFLGEGNSAGAYLSELATYLQGGNDYYGTLGLRGKFLNISDITNAKLEKNGEVNRIIEMTGLDPTLDYRIQSNLEKARYGFICIATDADHDGSHITALLINFFYRLFPTFVASGRLCLLVTPIVRVMLGKKTVERFYDISQFERWKEVNWRNNYKANYFKGLGSSGAGFVREDSQLSVRIYFIVDDQVQSSLDTAFSKKLGNERKQWIEQWSQFFSNGISLNIPPNVSYCQMNITQFINSKLVEYSKYTFLRALPSKYDGLKSVQRQILYFALNRWKYDDSGRMIKVSELQSGVSIFCDYHHGEAAMQGAIVKLGQDYPGSNNIPYLQGDGQFGTRIGNKRGIGADYGATRYIKVGLPEYVGLIYKKHLIELVECRKRDDEKDAEVLWIPSVVPMHIINGSRGVATAYKVDIPSHHPLDVIDFLIAYLNGQQLPVILPWYRGFKGKTEVVLKKKGSKDDELKDNNEGDDDNVDDDNDEDDDGKERLTLKTEGLFTILNERKVMVKGKVKDENGKESEGMVEEKYSQIEISELPLMLSTFKYKQWLDSLKERNQLKDYKVNPVQQKDDGPNRIRIVLYDFKGPANITTLKLRKSFGISNLNLVDFSGKPYMFNSIRDVILAYAENMLNHYERYRTHTIKELQDKLTKKVNIYRLLLLYKEEKIRPRDDPEIIEKVLVEESLPIDLVDEKFNTRDFSEAKLKARLEEMNKLREKISYYENLTATYIWLQDLHELRNWVVKQSVFNKLPGQETILWPTDTNNHETSSASASGTQYKGSYFPVPPSTT